MKLGFPFGTEGFGNTEAYPSWTGQAMTDRP